MAVEYASGSIRIPGLGNGTNFDDTVNKLYQLETRQLKQLLRWKADWADRKAAFQEIRAELNSLRTSLGKINTVDKFLTKVGSSSRAEVATGTPRATAQPGSYMIEVDRMATPASWSIETGHKNKNDVLNDSDVPGEFVFTYKGKEQKILIPKGTTLEGLKNLINNKSSQTGVKATLVQSGGGYVFQIRGMDTGKDAELTVDKASGITGMSLTKTEKWNTTGNRTFLNKTFDSLSSSANTNTGKETFVYEFAGKEYSVDIAPGESMQSVLSKMKTQSPGLEAGYVLEGGTYKFFIENPAPTTHTVAAEGADLSALISGKFEANDPVPAGTYQINIDGTVHTLDLPADAKIKDVAAAINKLAPGVADTVNDADGKLSLTLAPSYEQKYEFKATNKGTSDTFNYEPASASEWVVQHGQNARIRVDGWPSNGEFLEKSTNTVDDVIEGLTFNLRSPGTSSINVSIDSSAIEANIKEFVDSVNTFRKLIQFFTQVDKQKDVVKSDDSESLFDMQKGSVLTGNYGIQLMASRLKQSVAGQGVGFLYDIDTFSALSHIGILTNSTEGDPMYGLLEIKTVSDDKHPGPTLEEALKDNPEALAELFSAASTAISRSPAFGHSSHIQSLTQPGNYEVSYEVDASGNIINAKINGVEAKIDQGLKQIGLANSNPPNAADGLYIDIYDLNPTEPGKPHTGTMSIKSGKVNELIGLLDGPEGLLNKDKGTLGILEKNYKEIMDNIDKKVKREDERLIKWERTTRARFARLEETLKIYDVRKKALESQLDGLKAK